VLFCHKRSTLPGQQQENSRVRTNPRSCFNNNKSWGASKPDRQDLTRRRWWRVADRQVRAVMVDLTVTGRAQGERGA